MQKIYRAQHVFNIITKDGIEERILATDEKMPLLIVDDKEGTLELILEGLIFEEVKRFTKVSKVIEA